MGDDIQYVMRELGAMRVDVDDDIEGILEDAQIRVKELEFKRDISQNIDDKIELDSHDSQDK